jgi:hypothetical protein
VPASHLRVELIAIATTLTTMAMIDTASTTSGRLIHASTELILWPGH